VNFKSTRFRSVATESSLFISEYDQLQKRGKYFRSAYKLGFRVTFKRCLQFL